MVCPHLFLLYFSFFHSCSSEADYLEQPATPPDEFSVSSSESEPVVDVESELA